MEDNVHIFFHTSKNQVVGRSKLSAMLMTTHSSKTLHLLFLCCEVLATIATVAAAASVAAVAATVTAVAEVEIPSVIRHLAIVAFFLRHAHDGAGCLARLLACPEVVTAFVIGPIPAKTFWPSAKDHHAVGAPHVPASRFHAILLAIGFAFFIDGGGKGH